MIATSLSEWDVPHVELAIFGTAEPVRISRLLAEFCHSTMHSPPAHFLFYQSSVGTVVGLQLDDGQRIVVKAHQPLVTHHHLTEVVRLRAMVASRLGLAPKVLAGPVPLGLGTAIVEEFVDRGTIRNGSDWSREGHVQAPTLDEARAFVAEYLAALGRAFSRDERELCAASFAYSVAYTCRCGHAAGVDARHVPGNFQHLLVTTGDELFAL